MVEPVSTFILGLLFYSHLISLLVGLACLFAQALCLVWAPFAAILSALFAHRTDRSVWRYAIAGALASVFLFAPWVYLMRGLRNSRISGDSVAAELSGQDEVGEDWQDITVSDAAILSGLSGGLGEVAFQVNGPSSNHALKMTRVRMVVEYAASGGGE